jgi:hypothetical protein
MKEVYHFDLERYREITISDYDRKVSFLNEYIGSMEQYVMYFSSLYYSGTQLALINMMNAEGPLRVAENLRIASYAEYNSWRLSKKAQVAVIPNPPHLLGAYLTGDEILIERYCDYGLRFHGEEGLFTTTYTFFGLQGCIRMDLDRIRTYKGILEKDKSRSSKTLRRYIPYFDALLERDEALYNESLKRLLLTSKWRTLATIHSNIAVSFEVMGLVKIARLYGLECHVKSPLLDFGLIDFVPTEPYPPLPFTDFSEVADLPDKERRARGYLFPWEKDSAKPDGGFLGLLGGWFGK